MALGVIGLLGFIVTIIGAFVMAIKRDPVWKKWLAAIGICFVMFVLGAVNDSPKNTAQNSANIITSSPQLSQPVQQSDSVPAVTNQTNVTANNDQAITPVAPATTPQTVQPATSSKTVSPAPTPQTNTQEQTVYITRTGAKYHRAGCRYLSKSCIPINLSDAKQNYTPCSVCNPPQ